jgi:hypothetical protein
VSWVSNLGAELTFESVSNRSYSVLYKDNINAALWERLTDVVARSSNWTAVVPDPSARTNRFYRVVTPKE